MDEIKRKKKNESQKKFTANYARPSVLIPKNKNELYKQFVSKKGYNSLNDYFNCIIEFDLNNNVIPCKNELYELNIENEADGESEEVREQG